MRPRAHGSGTRSPRWWTACSAVRWSREGSYAAAWGASPVVLRCGVQEPGTFDEYSSCQITNGVAWFIPEEQITGDPVDITMTTIGRSPVVEVRLPAEHFPPANAMVDLARAIKQTTRKTATCG